MFRRQIEQTFDRDVSAKLLKRAFTGWNRVVPDLKLKNTLYAEIKSDYEKKL